MGDSVDDVFEPRSLRLFFSKMLRWLLATLEGETDEALLTLTPAVAEALEALLTRSCPTHAASIVPPPLGEKRPSIPTDWHLEPGVQPYVRVDGSLGILGTEEAWPLAWQDNETLRWLGRITIGSKCNDVEHEWGGWRFRVHCQIAHRNAKPALALMVRRLPRELPTGLRLPREFIAECRNPRGIIVISGGTGSGKSTTLAQLVRNHLPQEGLHIISYENPIEYRHESGANLIRQLAMGSDFNSFAEALGEQALRADPEILVPAELRETDAIRAALDAADTGHLVIGTLHLATAPTVVNRIVTAAGSEYADKMSKSLRVVICQTLVKVKGGGRVAAFEQLVITPAMRGVLNLVNKEDFDVVTALEAEVKGNGIKSGSFCMEHSLAVLVNLGRVTLEQALGYAPRPEILRANYAELAEQAKISSANLYDLYKSKTAS